LIHQSVNIRYSNHQHQIIIILFPQLDGAATPALGYRMRALRKGQVKM
jgi:hypothetical protein